MPSRGQKGGAFLRIRAARVHTVGIFSYKARQLEYAGRARRACALRGVRVHGRGAPDVRVRARPFGEGRADGQPRRAVRRIGVRARIAAQAQTRGQGKAVVQNGSNTVIYELNNSPSAKSLFSMLPLDFEVENYGHNEKIFYSSTDS